MATDKSVLDLPVVTNISDDDYVFSIVSSQATRLKWSTLTNIVNAWEGISDKPFDTYDDKYFTTNTNTDGATQLTLTTDVYQHIHDHLNMDLINKLNIYNDELYYGDQQIMLDLTYDTLRGKPYDNMSDEFTIADITVDDVITKQLQLSQSVTDKLHTHENKSVVDLFSESDSKLFWNGTAVGSDYELPVATTDTIGGVKPDGTTITIDTDGTLHGASQGLDFDALSTAMTTGAQSGITVTADTENSRFNFEVTGMSTIAIDSEGYWTIDGKRGENPTKAQGEKGSDGLNGKDGASPTIDPNTKNWIVGTVDTGVKAEAQSNYFYTGVEFPISDLIDGDLYLSFAEETKGNVYQYQGTTLDWALQGNLYGGGAVIDDTSTVSNTVTWSASKINSVIGDINTILASITGGIE